MQRNSSEVLENGLCDDADDDEELVRKTHHHAGKNGYASPYFANHYCLCFVLSDVSSALLIFILADENIVVRPK